MAQPYLDILQDLVGQLRSDRRLLVCKHFFSGAALYSNGSISASLSPKGLAFKLSEERCAEVIRSGLAIPLRYFENSPVKVGYALFPDYDQLGESQLSDLLDESIQYVQKADA